MHVFFGRQWRFRRRLVVAAVQQPEPRGPLVPAARRTRAARVWVGSMAPARVDSATLEQQARWQAVRVGVRATRTVHPRKCARTRQTPPVLFGPTAFPGSSATVSQWAADVA